MRKLIIFIFAINLNPLNVFCQKNVSNHDLFYLKACELSKNVCQDSIKLNDSLAFTQLSFFENDFKITLHSNCYSVAFLNIDCRIQKQSPYQVSLLGIMYKNETDVSSIKKKIEKMKRSNLKVKVLSLFKVFYYSNEVLIVVSETPNNPALKKIFNP